MRAKCACLVLLAAALGGCQTRPKQAAQIQYECRENPPWHGTQSHLVTTIEGAPGAPQIDLTMADGQSDVLMQVAGTSGALFTDSVYAWRFNGTRALLTNIANIRTYACDPLAPAPQ